MTARTMALVNARDDGWIGLKQVVALRDRVCVATRDDIFGKDVAPDLCRNGVGWTIDPTDWRGMEFEHVRIEPAMSKRADDDEAHGVLCCGWHHRLSNQWRIDTSAHREKVRGYLASRYPTVWAEWLERHAGVAQVGHD